MTETTEKLINTDKLLKSIYNIVFILDYKVSEEQVLTYLKNKIERDDTKIEEQITSIVKYCVLAHDRIIEEIIKEK